MAASRDYWSLRQVHIDFMREICVKIYFIYFAKYVMCVFVKQLIIMTKKSNLSYYWLCDTSIIQWFLVSQMWHSKEVGVNRVIYGLYKAKNWRVSHEPPKNISPEVHGGEGTKVTSKIRVLFSIKCSTVRHLKSIILKIPITFSQF